MIQVNNTPNYAGVTIAGDYYDFDQLYDALHTIVGDEGEHPNYDDVRIRVLGLCYDLRHAKMGNREYLYVDHGLNEDSMKFMGVVGPKKNIYLSFDTFYPEILFIIMALNDFISMYQVKVKHPDWNSSLNTVRQFQSAVITCLQETLSPQKFNMMVNNMNSFWHRFPNYFTHYVDLLNLRFIKWDKEKRLKNISIMAKRLVEQGEEYESVKAEILEIAAENNCRPSQIRPMEEYPEEVDW